MQTRTAKPIALLTMLAIVVTMIAFQSGQVQVTLAQTPAATVAPTATPKPLISEEGTLTIWVDRERVPMIEKVGKAFEDKYKVPIRVQQLGFGDIRDQLKLAGPAGEGPDIIIGAHDWLGELVVNGLLTPLDMGDKAKSFDPVSLKAFTYDGKLYGLPYLVEAIALYYNKDLVPEPPQTWAELKDIAKKLQDEKKVDQGYVLQQADPYHTYPIITGFGGYVFGRDSQGSYDPKDVGLDSAGGLKAAKEIDSMVKAGLLRPDVNYETMLSLFKSGKSAMFMTGPWALNEVRKSGVKYGVAKIPKMDNVARPFVGSQGFMVSKYSKNELLAQTFLTEFIATDEAMQTLYDTVPSSPSWLPVRAKVTDADITVFASSASDGEPMPAIPQMSAVWEAWSKGITLIFQQQADAEQAMKDAAKAIRDKIASAK